MTARLMLAKFSGCVPGFTSETATASVKLKRKPRLPAVDCALIQVSSKPATSSGRTVWENPPGVSSIAPAPREKPRRSSESGPMTRSGAKTNALCASAAIWVMAVGCTPKSRSS